MSWTIERDAARDDGTPITVEVLIESVGNSGNGWDDAGEGPELGIVRAWLREGDEADVQLTDAERERIEEALCGDPDLGDFLDDGPDDWDGD